MTDVTKTQHGSKITLFMEVPVEAVHKPVNYAFLCESFCALSPLRDRSSCVLNFLLSTYYLCEEMWSMKGKEKLFDLDRFQTHYPRILITDGQNVLITAMRNLSGFLPTQKFTLQG